MEQIFQILIKGVDGNGAGGVEGQGDHTFDGGKIHFENRVIVCALLRMQGAIIIAAAMDGQRFLYHIIGLPDRAEAGGLRGHDIDAASVVHGKTGDTGAEELHNGIFYGAGGKGLLDDAQRHILRAHAGAGLAGEVDTDHRGHIHVIGTAQQLLDQLRPALADGHGAVSAVAGMGVRADDHFAAAGIALPHIGVDHCHMCGYKFAAVFLCGRQTEYMIVFVDGAAYGTEAVMTVGENIRKRKFRQAAGPGSLDDADIGDIVGRHCVKFDFQPVHISAEIVGGENAVGHGFAAPCVRGESCPCAVLGGNGLSGLIVAALLPYCYHEYAPPGTSYILGLF